MSLSMEAASLALITLEPLSYQLGIYSTNGPVREFGIQRSHDADRGLVLRRRTIGGIDKASLARRPGSYLSGR